MVVAVVGSREGKKWGGEAILVGSDGASINF